MIVGAHSRLYLRTSATLHSAKLYSQFSRVDVLTYKVSVRGAIDVELLQLEEAIFKYSPHTYMKKK